MRILRPISPNLRRIALLPAAYHPPTLAHEALLRAALEHVDAAIAVLPRSLPHKEFDRVSFEQRLDLLAALVQPEPLTAYAVSAGGLFIEMAREAREHFPTAEIFLVCGRDAAERIVNWRYESHPPIEDQLNEFGLLVAPRGEAYSAPSHLSHRIRPLALDGEFQRISSTDLRERIARGEPWAHLAPERLRERIARLYS